jgi:hypothetical protein
MLVNLPRDDSTEHSGESLTSFDSGVRFANGVNRRPDWTPIGVATI